METPLETLPQALSLWDAAIRGGAIALTALLGVKMARNLGRVGQLGALFCLGAVAYLLASSTALDASLGVFTRPVHVLALGNSIFFWWFATALFDDNFRWRWWRFVPILVIGSTVLVREVLAPGLAGPTYVVHEAMVLTMMLHAIVLAVRDRAGDLVEPRRRFRLIFAGAIGVTGVIIAVAETILYGADPAAAVSMVGGFGFLVLAAGFTVWFLPARAEFLRTAHATPTPAGDDASPQRVADALADAVAPADRATAAKLMELMDAGVYREPELTVAVLADKVGAPEHRLRRVINQGLGYRNFGAFLNERRIADAKAILADPNQARRQVLQVALDLGYGSVGPFNRAFKDATEQTPTAFRAAALAGE